MTGGDTATDAVVIGGGLAGLAAATTLARGGRRVALFEKAQAPGGRARTTDLDGYHLNLGPHALYRGGRGAAVLRELGIPFRGGQPTGRGGFAVYGGALHTLPIGFVSLLTTGLLRAKDKIEAARLLSGLPRIDSVRLRDTTLADWLRTEVSGPRVRELMAAIVRVSTYADDPLRLSAGAALAQVQLALARGVLYLDHGWQSLVDGLRTAAQESGVRMFNRCPAATVLHDRGVRGVRGVRLQDGTVVEAKAVVMAVGPRAAAELASGGEPTVVTRWARAAVPVHAACLDVALRRLPRQRALFALGIDEPTYLSVHSAAAHLAPEGGALVHVARYGGVGDASEATVEDRLAGLLDAVQPGWRDLVVHRRFLPRVIVSNALVTAAQGGTRGRPGPEVPDVPGLYVAGDWVGRDGLLADASLASAREAARAILAAPRRPTAAA